MHKETSNVYNSILPSWRITPTPAQCICIGSHVYHVSSASRNELNVHVHLAFSTSIDNPEIRYLALLNIYKWMCHRDIKTPRKFTLTFRGRCFKSSGWNSLIRTLLCSDALNSETHRQHAINRQQKPADRVLSGEGYRTEGIFDHLLWSVARNAGKLAISRLLVPPFCVWNHGHR